MKIKEGFILKDVAGSKIVIATGKQKLDFNGVITFNEVGAAIFSMLDGTRTVEEIVSSIAAEYQVEESVVAADVQRLIEKMKKHGLVEE